MLSEMDRLSASVLTVASAPQRQSHMREVLESARGLRGIPYAFTFAVAPADVGLTYDDEEAYLTKGRTLSPAELSCFASHFKIIEDWLEGGSSKVLMVMEDDVYLDPWFDFGSVAGLASDAGLDYLRLYSRNCTPARLIAYQGRTQIVRFTWSPSGTQGYMLTRRGAARVVAHVKATGRIVRPIDDLLDRYWETGNAVYGLFPSPMIELNFPTLVHRKDQLLARGETQKLVQGHVSGRLGTGQAARIRTYREKLRRRVAERKFAKNDRAASAGAIAYMRRKEFRQFLCEEALLPVA